MARRPARRACHAGRDRQAGSRTPADDFRSAVHRAAWITAPEAYLLAGLPDAVGAADDTPARKGRLCNLRAAGGLSRWRVGSACRRLDDPGAPVLESAVAF